MYSPQPDFINFILDGCEWRIRTIAHKHNRTQAQSRTSTIAHKHNRAAPYSSKFIHSD